MAEQPAPLSPSDRLLCGPGPTNVDPAALEAMRKPMLGHLDPELHDILLDLVGLLRSAYRAESGIVLPLQSTGTSGMEAGIANLVERGDTVIVGASGSFGTRIAEVARRCGADVVRVTADWACSPSSTVRRRPAPSIRSRNSAPRCGTAGRCSWPTA